jgi:tRNA dimethylallyltransferase
MHARPKPLIVILGTTASGKTRLAVSLARALDGEVISVDSRQVYRGLDLGTGKDLQEYGAIRYHLIDILDPTEEYSLFDFACGFASALSEIHSRRKLPIAVGGTALYLKALLERYPLRKVPPNPARRAELATWTQAERVVWLRRQVPDQHNTSDLLDPQRTIRAIEIAEAAGAEDWHWPSFDGPLLLGLRTTRSDNRRAITERLRQRLDQGMIEEVVRLHQQGVSWQQFDYMGLEYRFVACHLQGLISKNDLFQKLNSAIHQFAKQQEKWFRRMEQHGHVIHWFDAEQDNTDAALECVRNWQCGSAQQPEA